MDIKSIGIAALVVFAIAIVLGAGLIFADFKFSVKKDPKQVELEENVLPGYNCGACGYPSCSGYADGLVNKGDTDFNKCKPGGAAAAAGVAKTMAS